MLNSFAYWVILSCFLSSADYFQNNIFRKNIQENHQSVKRSGPESGSTL